jgi:hypothetical protein
MKNITRQLALSLLVLSLLAVSVNAGEIQHPSARAPISNTQSGITAQAGEIGNPSARQGGYTEQLLVNLSGLILKLF